MIDYIQLNWRSIYIIIYLNLKLITASISTMLSSQLVYEFLPKKIIQWTPSDVELWFSKNKISVKVNFSFQQQKLDGKKLMNISPKYLVDVCGVGSRVLSKKIVEWIENEVQQFQEYLQEKIESTRIDNEKQQNQNPITERNQRKEKEIQNNINKQNQAEQPSIYENQSIKHMQGIRPLDMVQEIKVQKWKKRKPLFNNEDILITGKSEHLEYISKSKQSQKSIIIPQGAHFIRSSYQQCVYSIQFLYNNKSFLLQESGTIGRLKHSTINIVQDSISRKHAQVLKFNNKFYIKDVGSTHGTSFLLTNNVQLLINDILIIDKNQFQIVQLKLNKKESYFSINIRDLTKQLTINYFQCKNKIYVYKNDNIVHFSDKWRGKYLARIKVENGKICLCPEEQSTIYRKLKSHELYEISESEMMIRLGSGILLQSKLIKTYKPIVNITPFHGLQQNINK